MAPDDPRLSQQSIAATVLSYLRFGIELHPATSYPTAQVEYVVPHAVLLAPYPVIAVMWNRVDIYITDDAAPYKGWFYLYRTEAGEQRVRLGRNPDEGDKVTAHYVIDPNLAG